MNQYTVWAKGLQISEDLDLDQRNVGKALNRNNRWYNVSIIPKKYSFYSELVLQNIGFRQHFALLIHFFGQLFQFFQKVLFLAQNKVL